MLLGNCSSESIGEKGCPAVVGVPKHHKKRFCTKKQKMRICVREYGGKRGKLSVAT